jgi:hypothetical protein
LYSRYGFKTVCKYRGRISGFYNTFLSDMNKGQVLNGSVFPSLKVEVVKHKVMKVYGELEV